MINKTKYYSWNLGSLPKGCQLCVKGSKLVLFVTGVCPRSCYFCPLSDHKYKKDVIYADEWPVDDVKQIIKEAKMIDAKGAGITGGDPLARLERTCKFIKKLKKEFGKNFHIHLYTSFDLVNEKTLKKLYDAGLDEIRFHPDFDNDKLWSRILIADKFKWDIGIEVPAIPKKEKELRGLIDYFSDKVKFINLNELEVADNEVSALMKRGYRTKNSLSYAVKGSQELALRLLKYADKKYSRLNVHYCTAQLKDKAQLSSRIKRRAKNAKKPYDKVTKEGILVRGAVYGKDLVKLRRKLMNKYKVKSNMIEIDDRKKRLLTSTSIVRKIKEKDLQREIVYEYPTYDQTEVEAIVLETI